MGAASLGMASSPRPSDSVSIALPAGMFEPPPAPLHRPVTRITLDLEAPQTQVSINLPRAEFVVPVWSRAAARMKNNLSPELVANFDLFVYVNKAARGATAQRMFVFDRKQKNFALLYDWAVSTGREKIETNKRGALRESITPAGYYELDPDRFYANYRSYAWNEPMPYAMFFNWMRQGEKTGLAIHATDGEDQLGSRASAGCVRLSLDHARALFALVTTKYRGATPQFAFDRASESSSNNGALSHDAKGRLRFADGYRVLVVIDDFTANDQVAALF